MNEDDVAERLRALAGWKVRDSVLTRRFEFPDFATALAFANRVGEVAERANHHPDLLVGWGKVVVELTTHSAGGLTGKDFELAAEIDRL